MEQVFCGNFIGEGTDPCDDRQILSLSWPQLPTRFMWEVFLQAGLMLPELRKINTFWTGFQKNLSSLSRTLVADL